MHGRVFVILTHVHCIIHKFVFIIFEDVTAKKTPQKFYRREVTAQLNSDQCRLCETITESRRLIRVFSGAGCKRSWRTKISQTCGVVIDVNDYLPTVICRKCRNFVDKMFEFVQKCHSTQLNLKQHYFVKRGASESPSFKQPTKHTCNLLESDNCPARRELEFSQSSTESDGSSQTAALTTANSQYTTSMNINIQNKSFISPTHVSVRTIVPKCSSKINQQSTIQVTTSKSVFISNYQTYVTAPLTSSQRTKLERAIGTRLPTAVADVIAKECASVKMVIKRNILDISKSSCDTVCKRLSGSSVLYSSEKQFEAMDNFSIDKVWIEMKTTQPFLIDLMNAITGNQVDIDKTNEEAKVKYCFIYSILMQMRWHELSLFQRIITVLLIEGGCGKQVV